MRIVLLLVFAFTLQACSGNDYGDLDAHKPENLIVNIKINNGNVIAALYTRDKKIVNDPSIDVRLNGEPLAHIYSEIEDKAYYTGTIEHGQTAVFAIAMDNREFLLTRSDMPKKVDETDIRVNILPNDNLEISWDHLGKYNKIKIYKAILLNPFPILNEEPRITLADDFIEYDVKIGKGEHMLPPEWLVVDEGRLYELVMDIEAEYSETVSDVFHPDSKIEIRYEYEHHVDVSRLR